MKVDTFNKEKALVSMIVKFETLRRFVSSSNHVASHHQYRGTSADRKWGSSHLMTGLVITPPPILAWILAVTQRSSFTAQNTRNKIIQKHLCCFLDFIVFTKHYHSIVWGWLSRWAAPQPSFTCRANIQVYFQLAAVEWYFEQLNTVSIKNQFLICQNSTINITKFQFP